MTLCGQIGGQVWMCCVGKGLSLKTVARCRVLYVVRISWHGTDV